MRHHDPYHYQIAASRHCDHAGEQERPDHLPPPRQHKLITRLQIRVVGAIVGVIVIPQYRRRCRRRHVPRVWRGIVCQVLVCEALHRDGIARESLSLSLSFYFSLYVERERPRNFSSLFFALLLQFNCRLYWSSFVILLYAISPYFFLRVEFSAGIYVIFIPFSLRMFALCHSFSLFEMC